MKHLLLALFVTLLSSQSIAHTTVVSSTVSDKQVSITFDEIFALTTIRVSSERTNIDKKYRKDRVVWGTDHQFTIEPLPKGDFTLEWRGLAKDGHVIKGQFDISVNE